ncbi:MAG: sporulation transcriptional regulator SpoIIID [Eubacterium sp.]|nr:sporulation transcriptional regulator SpoIIID [Eubacterium sp.]MCI9617629.1 sporulation transcriptional regulator SpoIIID [Eubacterium sp.]
MKAYIEERVLESAKYIINNKATVRSCAKQFGISKSTVHKDVSERLTQISPVMASKVKEVLDKNKSERHIRGGMATREKYRRKRG